ncbi:MAG TPA: aminotransferase class IV [Bacteroidales bacterium]|nr:aminotransferase class IV [Bacteroidales bacterium]HPF03002.1 aminotransferase class IV [Bacteroidales bacterium]HPJ59973.1 aminotransferase class IV [Bacteroidales bacterium]HPR13062.1 aminotransferase class IV [Bacteroidales bacterium]HRW86738.1 aminotransferase class IV [Bacteroidales bacterium]
METAWFNGSFIPKEEVRISPDDRGFLFADGIYEVVRWYRGGFFDMDSHLARMKRSMSEILIKWEEAGMFPRIAETLITRNGLEGKDALVYIQVTRGAAKRTHAFPKNHVDPTLYACAWGFDPARDQISSGIHTILKKDPRWNRCDIKSVSLLPNILSFQEAVEAGAMESIFVRDGLITECAHSNVFFVMEGKIFTHPESTNILSGITRKNVIRLAKESGLVVIEEALPEDYLEKISEAFVTNTSFEVAPVISINKNPVGNGKPGPLSLLLREKFDTAVRSMLH